MNNQFAFIIPTRNRPDELARLLHSFEGQKNLPRQIIIVDGSDGNVSFDNEFSQLNILYQHVTKVGLTAQRNAGILLLDEGIEYVCFLDDDIVLCEEALAFMQKFWSAAPDEVGGAVFNIINDKTPGPFVFLKAIFFSGKKERGAVLLSGFNTLVCPADQTKYVQWLFGGGTVWRKKIFKEFLFDEWFEGDGLCEDLEFSYRVGKSYKLAVVEDARILHLTAPVSKRNNYLFGISEMKNRFYFVKKNPEFSKVLFFLACCGQMLENLVRGVFTLNKGYIERLGGNLAGIFQLAGV